MTALATSACEARLLIVDDESNIVELLEASFRFHGFEVRTCLDGTSALTMAKQWQPDLMITDVMMPGLTGFELVRSLRADGCQLPVVFLTAKDAVDDRVAGLTMGADDYVLKPFSLSEVLARIRAVLKRTGPAWIGAEPDRLVYADLVIDEAAHEVFRDGQRVALSPMEFRLLCYLAEHAENVLSKAQILDSVWQYGMAGDANVVESCISSLRRKIDSAQPNLIHTVRGVGYVLRLPRE